MTFEWDKIKRDEDGKIILLYRHQRIIDEGLVLPGMRVLDVGGWGVLAQRLINEGVSCVILDNFSEDQYFPDRVWKLPHMQGDITQLSEPSIWGTDYDVITCFEMLEHCSNQSLGVKNMYALLKPGGILVGTFPIPGKSHPVDDPSVTFLTGGELRAVLLAAGFNDVLVEPTGSVTKEEEPCSLYFRARK